MTIGRPYHPAKLGDTLNGKLVIGTHFVSNKDEDCVPYVLLEGESKAVPYSEAASVKSYSVKTYAVWTCPYCGEENEDHPMPKAGHHMDCSCGAQPTFSPDRAGLHSFEAIEGPTLDTLSKYEHSTTPPVPFVKHPRQIEPTSY